MKEKARFFSGLFFLKDPTPSAPGGVLCYLQEKRVGLGPQAELDPVSVLLGPPQQNGEMTRCGLESPHLGQVIFRFFSAAPWIFSKRSEHLEHSYS